MKITQTKVIGTFRVIQSPPKEDILPPSRVSDLRVALIDIMNRMVLLQWTAPGDDYDHGKAKKYVIKLSNYWMTLTDFTFNLKENVLLETDEYQPANSGITENVRVQCPLSNFNATYYIALLATDDKANEGKVSNIIQIHFKEAYFPSNDSVEISTKTSNIYQPTTTSLTSTEVFIDNFTSSDSTTDNFTPYEATSTTDESATVVTTNITKDGFFIEKNIFIIAASSSGVLLLILIILNIVICCCCFKKKHSEKPRKLSRKASLRPPYNLNIAYKHGSEISLDEEHAVSNSLSTLVDHSTVYSSSDGKETQEMRYTYHTDRSLRNKMDSQSRKDDLGFNLVQPMPAYATSSLSRFAARHAEMDNETVSTHERSNAIQLQKLNNTEDTHVYPLGLV